jgi:hypothetical protein
MRRREFIALLCGAVATGPRAVRAQAQCGGNSEQMTPMFGSRLPLLPPRSVPWSLKPLESAETSLRYDEYARMVMTIRHDVLKGLSPDMLAWWFRNIGGEMELDGQWVNKYLLWHPIDHIKWELIRPARDTNIGPGAVFRIVEAFNADPDLYVDIQDKVIRLDPTGFTLVQRRLGVEVARLNHDFAAVQGGASYFSTLIVGSAAPRVRSILNPLLHRFVFTERMGRAWLKHNVEEVGALEHIVPRIYPR